jgi:hypothetical protein
MLVGSTALSGSALLHVTQHSTKAGCKCSREAAALLTRYEASKQALRTSSLLDSPLLLAMYWMLEGR